MALAAVLAIAAALATGDIAVSHREMDQLLDEIARSENAMNTGQRTLANIKPASGETWSGTQPLTSSDAAAALDEIKAACRDAAVQTETAGDRVSDVAVLPWHVSLAKARSRYVTHNRTWQRYYQGCATDPAVILDGGLSAQINATYRTAGRAVRDAEPLFANHADAIRALFGATS